MFFWIDFGLLVLNWFALTWLQGIDGFLSLLSVLFFAGFFIVPIIDKSLIHTLYYFLSIISFTAFWSSLSIPFLWLIFIILILEYSFIATNKHYTIFVSFIIISLSSLLVFQNQHLSSAGVFFLLSLVSYFIHQFKKTREERQEYKNNYKQLSDQYTQIKRQMVTQEQVARQEERSHIAREIHDSVGHRLTALLMQLEVARHQATEEESKQYFTDLKALAQESLHDTRTAVKALRSDETAGIQAIIQLIRKLESESHLEIRFIIQSGVLGVKLSNSQSVAVYRSIQEALTNMMRHSQTRQATIEFNVLGDRYLQFKVCHALNQKVIIKEGFGLTSMRNRLNELNGTLTLTQEQNELRVIGQFPLQR